MFHVEVWCEHTPGTISAFPSSTHSEILASICSRTSDLISPVSPANKARNPWLETQEARCERMSSVGRDYETYLRELMTSIS